ncbi:MAG: ABC transporter permease [Chloroflexota bacterium]|nr:ABC transporter permease [Chloroflexota bacterium]
MANVERVRTAPLPPRTAARSRIGNVGQTAGAAAFLVLLLLYNALFNADAFLNAQSFRLNLTQVAPIVIVAVGMTLVVATGGIDLSVGSLMAIAGAVAPLIFLSDRAPFSLPYLGGTLAYVIPVAVAGLFGFFNGWLVTSFRLQPIIATLVLFVAGRGVAQVITDGRLQSFREPDWQFIGLGRVLGVPFQAVLMAIVVAVAAWAMRATTFGRYVLAVGDNEAAARLSGVPADRVKRAVYAISGLLSGLAGLIFIAINSSSDANQIGLNVELDAIAAVAVGGTSLLGGRATIIGTLIGAFIIQLIRFTLLTQNVSDATARVVTAAAIIVGVLVQRRRSS